MIHNKTYEINDLMNRVCMLHRPNLHLNEYDSFIRGLGFIREGLIKSYGAEYICDNLEHYFILTNDPGEYQRNKHYQGLIMGDMARFSRYERDEKEFSVIMLVIPNSDKDKNHIEHFMTACGWYKSYEDEDSDYLRGNDTLIVYEKKYQEDIAGSEYDKNLPRKLYHITQDCYVDKILKKGLIPRHNDKLSVHPDRIYFLPYKPDEFSFSRIAKPFMVHGGSNDYVQYDIPRLLEVDITSMIGSVKFFVDPNAEGCLYCIDNIPPSLIKVVY